MTKSSAPTAIHPSQWMIIYLMRPNLGNVEGVETIPESIFRVHDLNVNSPRGTITLFNGIEEITSSIIRILTSNNTSLFSAQVLDTLVSLEVPLDILEVAVIINQLESVRGVTIHETITIGSTTVGEENRDLVNGFRYERKEIPESIRITTVGLRVSLLGVDEIYNSGERMISLYFSFCL